MNLFTRPLLTGVAAAGLLFSGVSAALAAPKDYQFTGPVTAMTDTTLSVQKGKETWEFAKDATTKTPTDLKVGDKVTVHYVMNAVSVEPSAGKVTKAPKDKAAKGAKADAAAKTDAAASPAAEASPKP